MLRSIPLRTRDIKLPNEKGELCQLTWAYLLRAVLTAPRRNGVQINELRQIGKVLDALEAAEMAGRGELLLDEAQWNYLLGAVDAHAWGAYVPDIIVFTDDVLAAAQVDPNAPARAA